MKHTRNSLLAAALVLALVTMACGFNLPVTQIKTGPTRTMDIQIPLPQGTAEGVELNLEFMAGDLKLTPGASGQLASGMATFNVAELEPKIETAGSVYSVRQGDLKIKGIPRVQGEFKNEWDLQLADRPMSLSIKAGAYTGNVELGGLALEKLAIEDGGATFNGSFSKPNRVEMSTFTYSTGASTVSLKGLANANFTQMTFNAGAGDYTLSFDGDLRREANVTIDAGIGSVTIIVPQGANAKVVFDGSLSSVKPEGGWSRNENAYTLAGSGPALTITVKMGAGSLILKTS